jgi:SAM-dependent methyltransferase
MDTKSAHTAGDGAKFDAFAPDYVAVHQRNIALSGEQPVYFATYKLHCLERLVGAGFDLPVLDYGCGVGMVTEQLCTRFSDVHGYDPSGESLSAARARASAAHFHGEVADVPDAHFGLIVMSGVLHHVPPSEREEVLAHAVQKLRPGQGRLVVFEHNPLNPLTRRTVAMCPFDDDAVLLWPWEASRLLKRSGLCEVRLRFIVFLPRVLSSLRWLEPRLGAVPLGAQVMVVGRAADSSSAVGTPPFRR